MDQQAARELHGQLKSTLDELLQGKDTIRGALGLDDERILALAVFARELVDQGRVDDAQSILEGLVVLDPKNSYLHTCLGALYMQKGLPDAAIVEFGVAVTFTPDDIAANTYLGELFLERGDLDRSVRYLQQAVQLDPEMRDPYANRARTLAALVATIAKEVREKGPSAMEEIRRRAEQLEAMQA